MPWAVAAAAVAAGGSLLASSNSSDAAQNAANTQANAANQATQAQLQMFNQTQKNLQPFLQGGTNSLAALQQFLGLGPNGQFNPNAPGVQSFQGATGMQAPTYNPMAPFTSTTFQQSPGYAWAKSQGIDAIQNSAAAKGGVASGNTLQALDTFGTGLAQQDYYNAAGLYNTESNMNNANYQVGADAYYNALNSYLTQQGNTYNRLYDLVGTGANAGANLGGFARQTGQQIGSNIIGAGNAQAAGIVGSSNALNGGLNAGTSSLQRLLNNTSFQNTLNGWFGGGTPATNDYTGGV